MRGFRQLLHHLQREAWDRDLDFPGQAVAPSLNRRSHRHLHGDRGLRDVDLRAARRGVQHTLEAGSPGGGKELPRIDAVRRALQRRAAQRHIQDAVVTHGVTFPAPRFWSSRHSWSAAPRTGQRACRYR